MSSCKICGEENCKKHSILLAKPKKITEFSGSSPPEVFVGKWNYPNVYTGILSPTEYGENEVMSSAEEWHRQRLPIPAILKLRSKLIYGRTQSNVMKAVTDKKFLPVMQEVAMTHKSVATEFKLKKPISQHDEKESRVPLISHAAPVESVKLQENAPVQKKIDYLVNDAEIKSAPALVELHKSGIQNSSLIKILSAGLLGLRKNRKLVPTRWSITAVDDTISKEKLERIRYYQEISEFQVFTAEYLGNHYEFLLLPDKWSFEVIEISVRAQQNPGLMNNFPKPDLGWAGGHQYLNVVASKGSTLANETSYEQGGHQTSAELSQHNSPKSWQDYETFFPRKKYADSVTGAYYANRLALTEYLDKIKRQCSCLVIREIRPEYDAPLGVGILRQTSREAFQNKPNSFPTLKEALENIQSRLRQPISNYTNKSFILKNFGKQKKISEFFNH